MELSHLELTPPPPGSDTTDVETDDHDETVQPKERSWPREVISSFSPAWFASTMGTGVVAINLYSIPYPTTWLRTVSIVFFVGNTALFCFLVALGILHILLGHDWRKLFDVHHAHGQGLFLGTIPMGFATIISMYVPICVPIWGPRTLDIAWGLWLANEAISMTITMGIMTGVALHPPTPLSAITPVHLLPFLAPIVSAGTGAGLAAAMPLPSHAARATATLSLSYLSLGMGLSFALLVLGIYFLRLFLFGIPGPIQRSSFLVPLGPLGKGAATLIVLGRAASDIGASNDASAATAAGSGTGTGRGGPGVHGFNAAFGQALHATGTLTALMLWGMGLVWLALACFTFLFGRGRMHFAASWMSLIFPMGVYAYAALQFGTVLGDSGVGQGTGVWGVVGTVLTGWLVVNWLLLVGGVGRSMVRRRGKPEGTAQL